MSRSFERVLVNPEVNALLRTLEEASRVGGYASSSQGGPTRWQPVVDEVASYTEGRSQLQHRMAGSSTPYLVVAWWTDHQHNKHVGVFSGVDSAGPQLHYSRLDHDPRPPLWHLYPDRLFLVRRPGQPPTWRAACACGVVGSPEELGWMGPRCGPCHDRVLEGEPVPGGGRLGMLPTGGSIFNLAFSPVGPNLAVSSEGRMLNLFNLDDGSTIPVYGGDSSDEYEELRPIEFSPDGSFLAAADPREALLRIWRVDGPTQVDWLEFLPDLRPLSLAFSPDGARLAACMDNGQVQLWGGQEHFEPTPLFQSGRTTSACFSPDGRILACGRRKGIVQLRDLSSLSSVAPYRQIDTGAGDDQEVMYLHFVRGGAALLLLTGREDWTFHSPLTVLPISEPGRAQHRGQLHLWEVAHNRKGHRIDLPLPSSLALTPDGRALAMVVHDVKRSPAEVVIWDVESWREAGRLEWNPEADVRCLAFSPDGQTLALGAADGSVVLAPWRLLLEG